MSTQAMPAHPGPRAPQLPAPPPQPRPPGSSYASTQLDPEPAAAGRARRLTREWLDRWDMSDLTDDAQAIASELIANALAKVSPDAHGLAIIYALHATPGQLRICVWDIGPGHPSPRQAAPDAETGRGLAMIHALTAGNWGWWPTPASGGKVTWAALAAPASPGPPAGYIP